MTRSFNGAAQQRQKTAARHGAEQVDDYNKEREWRPGTNAEKGHRDDLEVLRSENNDGGREQDNHGQIKPSHSLLLVRIFGIAFRLLRTLPQAQANADPARPGDHEVDPEEKSQNIE